MVYVAELDENDVCKAVSELVSLPEGDRFIVIGSLDESLLGKRFSGTWHGVDSVPTVRPVAAKQAARSVLARRR
jgi:hypothetical protein